MFDLLIKGGTLIDGTGSDGVVGDSAIQNGKIAAMGRINGEAVRVISASGMVVTPGFIDIHRHADAAVFRQGFGELELRQGLTTIVNGNCGLSLAPFGSAHKAEILAYLKPITGAAPACIETATMDGYLEQVGHQPLPINVGMLAGALICGFALAVMMANSGGAWDNAKKYIEDGNHGGKGSEAHKAAVVGDTVGDPFKDTSGPSINILIKLMTIVSLVFAPLFLAVGGIL